MEKDRLINVQELAYRVGCSIQTIGSYYRFKEQFPTEELAMMLPDFVRQGNRNTRYWRESDVAEIVKFRSLMPQGRNGALGKITQKYVKKGNNKATATKVAGELKPAKAGIPKRAYIDKIEAILQVSDVDVDVIDQVRELLESELEFRCYLKKVN